MVKYICEMLYFPPVFQSMPKKLNLHFEIINYFNDNDSSNFVGEVLSVAEKSVEIVKAK